MLNIGNFKGPNYKLETMGTNMALSKAVLLKSVKVLYRIIDAHKASNKHLCQFQTIWRTQSTCKIRLYHGV